MNESWGAYYHRLISGSRLALASAQRLAAFAGVRDTMAVLDLGGKTGLVSREVLAQAPGCRVYLAESSDSLRRAAGEQLGAGVKLLAAPPDVVAGELPEKVDRVLANLNFLSFGQPDQVLTGLRGALKPMGWLCFTLGGAYFNTGAGIVSPQWAFLRALHRAGLTQRDVPDPMLLPNQRSIEGTLHAAKFKPFHYELVETPFEESDFDEGGELHRMVQLDPPLSGATFQESVERSLDALQQLREQVLAQQPRWRAGLFGAQPAIAPEEALMLKFGGKLPK